MELRSKRLSLILKTREQVLAQIDAMPAEQRKEVSPVWLARLRAMEIPDIWTVGFDVFHRELGAVIGGCGFKGPPDRDGMVEIAYGIDAAHRGSGYATEA